MSQCLLSVYGVCPPLPVSLANSQWCRLNSDSGQAWEAHRDPITTHTSLGGTQRPHHHTHKPGRHTETPSPHTQVWEAHRDPITTHTRTHTRVRVCSGAMCLKDCKQLLVMVCPWLVPLLVMVCPWLVPLLVMVCPCMACPFVSDGVSMACPFVSDGVPMPCPFVSDGVSMHGLSLC